MAAGKSQHSGASTGLDCTRFTDRVQILTLVVFSLIYKIEIFHQFNRNEPCSLIICSCSAQNPHEIYLMVHAVVSA
ncbi:hypothetical protein ACS0TY_013639 [Phlomoides rotata]